MSILSYDASLLSSKVVPSDNSSSRINPFVTAKISLYLVFYQLLIFFYQEHFCSNRMSTIFVIHVGILEAF